MAAVGAGFEASGACAIADAAARIKIGAKRKQFIESPLEKSATQPDLSTHRAPADHARIEFAAAGSVQAASLRRLSRRGWLPHGKPPPAARHPPESVLALHWRSSAA